MQHLQTVFQSGKTGGETRCFTGLTNKSIDRSVSRRRSAGGIKADGSSARLFVRVFRVSPKQP
jgi:hypothetical protein